MFHCWTTQSKRGKTLKMQRSMKDIENAEPESCWDLEQCRFYEVSVNLAQSWFIFWKLQDHRHGSRGRGCKCWVPCTQSHDKVVMIRWRNFLILILALLWSLGLFNSFKDLRWWQWQVIHVFLDLASLSMFLLWNWINIFIAFCGFVTKEFGWVHSNECNLASTKMGKHHINSLFEHQQ